MTIDFISTECIKALRSTGYNESTVYNYEGVIQRFKQFCYKQNITEYSCEIGKAYAENVISTRTGRFSMSRYRIQGRFIRLIDSYFLTGIFDFSVIKRERISPDNPIHKVIYQNYQVYLCSVYENENTSHFYEYGMYCFLQFLNKNGIEEMNDINPAIVMKYIKETKLNRQREMLCELRGIFRYLNRTDLLNSIVGINAPRINRIIPTLTDA